MNVWSMAGARLNAEDPEESLPAAVSWIDLLRPTAPELETVAAWIGIELPVGEDATKIGLSSRLYFDGDAVVMVATLPAGMDSAEPVLAPVTFVLSGSRLVTVRAHDPSAFRLLVQRADLSENGKPLTGAGLFAALIELQLDRMSDVLERLSGDIDGLSREIFRARASREKQRVDWESILVELGRKAETVSMIIESLASLERLFSFGTLAMRRWRQEADVQARLKTSARDCGTLVQHAGALSEKISFLLDATLGWIGIEQNTVIKIFSVAAVVFLPPTLIASIYGMNFEWMPELKSGLGYPLALVAMIVSAWLPYWIIRRRGWI